MLISCTVGVFSSYTHDENIVSIQWTQVHKQTLSDCTDSSAPPVNFPFFVQSIILIEIKHIRIHWISNQKQIPPFGISSEKASK